MAQTNVHILQTEDQKVSGIRNVEFCLEYGIY